MSLLTKLDSALPPFICRLIARKHRGRVGMSHDDIAKASGLPKTRVAELSFKVTWAGISVDTADRFATACGVDLCHVKRQRQFFRHRHKGYIYKAQPAQRAMYDRLFKLLREWATRKRDEHLATPSA